MFASLPVAHYRPTVARALPADILDHVLERVSSVDTVVAMSHVCVWWRRLARDHPAFWRNVELNSAAPGSVQQFVNRLQVAAMRKHYSTVNITVKVVGVHADMERTVLPVVAALMDRVAILSLRLDAAYADVVQHLLAHNSPNISDLLLAFYSGPSSPDIVLPENIFRCQAPLLRILRLVNVQLPAHPVAALRNVEILRLSSSNKPLSVSPAALFSSCPMVAQLTLSAPSLHMQTGSHPSTELAGMQLAAVVLIADVSPHTLLKQWPALSRAGNLALNEAAPEITTAWLADLSGPIHLHVVVDEVSSEKFRVEFVEDSTRRTRGSLEGF